MVYLPLMCYSLGRMDEEAEVETELLALLYAPFSSKIEQFSNWMLWIETTSKTIRYQNEPLLSQNECLLDKISNSLRMIDYFSFKKNSVRLYEN